MIEGLMYQGNFFSSKKITSESGEAMPAAIITAIVSSILLLGITVVMSVVLQSRSDQKNDTELVTNASNIDISLRSDITQATYITASANLVQPTSRLLQADDISLNGMVLHIPVSTGECKVVSWSVDGTEASRSISIYAGTLNQGSSSERCDETSEVSAQRTKDFADLFLLQTPFTFNNHVGRKVDFTLDGPTLARVNDELDNGLKRNDTNRLSDAEFNELNKLLSANSLVAGFADSDACVMNAEKVAKVDGSGNSVTDSNGNPVLECPPAETATVAAAWNSTAIAKANVVFDLMGDSGAVLHREVEQSSSIPLR